MEQRFPLLKGAGTLTVRQEGREVRISAVLPDHRQGLYKGWLVGTGGGRLLLGTFLPENGHLVLRRTLALGELERRGCWPPGGGEAKLTCPAGESRCRSLPEGWELPGAWGDLLPDPVLREALEGSRGVLLQREGEGFRLAIPFDPREPLALTPLVCLMEPGELEGRSVLFLQFSGEGRPCGALGGEGSGPAPADGG